jgi:hypothetical protein
VEGSSINSAPAAPTLLIAPSIIWRFASSQVASKVSTPSASAWSWRARTASASRIRSCRSRCTPVSKRDLHRAFRQESRRADAAAWFRKVKARASSYLRRRMEYRSPDRQSLLALVGSKPEATEQMRTWSTGIVALALSACAHQESRTTLAGGCTDAGHVEAAAVKLVDQMGLSSDHRLNERWSAELDEAQWLVRIRRAADEMPAYSSILVRKADCRATLLGGK